MQDAELASIVSRLRSLELGLIRSHGHVIGAIAELERELALIARERKLVAESLACLELARPMPKRRTGT